MFTDPTHLQISDPGHTEGNVVFAYLDAFCTDEHFALSVFSDLLLQLLLEEFGVVEL